MDALSQSSELDLKGVAVVVVVVEDMLLFRVREIDRAKRKWNGQEDESTYTLSPELGIQGMPVFTWYTYFTASSGLLFGDISRRLMTLEPL